PAHDASPPLSGGPTACDARLAFARRPCTGTGVPPDTISTIAFASFGPAGLTPLKTLLARPSQKLRKLKIALTAEGVLRPVTWRTLVPWKLKTGSATVVQSSAAPSSALNVRLNWPLEPTTSPLLMGNIDGLSV